MSSVSVAERKQFWQNFDIRYHATHPGLRHMERDLWELPHWMTWLAGVLDSEGFTSIEALDLYSIRCDLEGVDQASALALLREHPGDVYLFSPMTPNLHFALEIASCAKKLYPESKTIFGGIAATPLRAEVAAHPGVDFVIRDRGEYALPALLRALERGGDLANVGNLTYSTERHGIVENSYTYPAIPVDQIPFPKIDLFPREVGRDLRYLRAVYALGCPYKCPFCTIQTIGHRPSYFPIERVLSEIRAYREYYGNHHYVYFGDETFTLAPKPTLEFCSALKEAGDIGYDCQTRLNCLTPAILKALKQSGCCWLEIGLESLSQKAQDAYKQRIELKNLEDTLARIREEGIPVCSFLVNGLPNQTIDDMKYTIDTACSLIARGLLHASYLFGLVPYPGSLMYENPESYGIKLRHRDFKRYHEDLEPVFDTEFATSEDIYRTFLESVRQLGQAMAERPYLGHVAPALDRQAYGKFWGGSHV